MPKGLTSAAVHFNMASYLLSEKHFPGATLAGLVLRGVSTELDYLTTDEQCDALDRVEFLNTCNEDEIADAAEFLALSVTR